MSFLLSLSPFRARNQDAQESQAASSSSSSSSSGSTSPTDIRRNGRRELTRQTPHESLRSPFSTPAKPSASNGKIGLLERHLLPEHINQRRLDGEDDDRSSSAESDEGCFLSQDDEDDVTRRNPVDLIQKLPHELAVLIFLHLSSHHSLLACGLVSRTWRSVAQDTIVWREFFYRNPGWRLNSPDQVEHRLSHLQDDMLLLREPQDADDTDPNLSIASLPRWSRRASTRSIPAPISHIDRLDWSVVYALRYHLSRRWGEVTPARNHGAHDETVLQRLKQEDEFKRRTAAMSEDWGDEEDDTEDEEELDNIASSDEEGLARYHAEREARQARRNVAAIDREAREGRFSMSLPKRWLPRMDAPEVRLFGSHNDYIYCVRTFPSYEASPTPSPGYIVTGSRDRTMRVWDIETGQCLHVLEGHTRSILSMDVCSQGDILVSGASDQMLGIWVWFGSPEAAEAKRQGKTFVPYLIDKWHCHMTVMDVRLSDDFMVLGLRNGQVRSYRRTASRTFQRVSLYHGHDCSVNDLKIQGDYVAAGYAGGALEIIHIPTGKIHRKFIHKKGVACVDFNGDVLVAGASDFIIRCWRVSTGQLLLTLRGHTELPRSIRFDAERGFLLSAGYDGRINVWDVSLILDQNVVDGSALGSDWRVLAVFYKQERLQAERSQARTIAYQQRLIDASKDSPTATEPPPHPLNDPPIAYRPRFFWRERAHSGRQQGQGGCRLFDAAFDGKRIIAVGESHTFTVREFLPEHERFDLRWEIFG